MKLTPILQRLAADVAHELHMQHLIVGHPLYGAYISPEHWLDEAGHVGTTRLIVRCGYLALAQARQLLDAPTYPTQETLLHRMEIATDYLLQVQRPSGLIDLRNTNYESGPDTAFALQLLCAFIEVAQAEPVFASILPKLETFARKATYGIMGSGFHTPNHRWVITAALAISSTLFPDINTRPVIDAYLAEGFDIDAEGAYLERSIAVYDAVTNRSLLLIADHLNDDKIITSALEAVSRNLDFDLHFFHADGTVETGLSTRQDYGQRVVPVTLIAPYLHAGIKLANSQFLSAANDLAERAKSSTQDTEWQSYVLFKYGEPPSVEVSIPTRYVKMYPLNRVWRFRQDDVSVSVFGGRTRLLHLVYRSAALLSLKIAQAYFSVGLFIADALEIEDEQVVLHSSGKQKPNLPAYHLPLGQPVAPADFEESKHIRQHTSIPPAESALKIERIEDGFALHYRTLDGLEDVLAQIAFDFPSGGIWETADTALICLSGMTIFLKSGYGRMRFGTDVIEINPGANAHLSSGMRHSEPPGEGQVRVLLTFTTPVDHQFTLRTYQLLSS